MNTVTEEHIHSIIKDEKFHRLTDVLTICVLTLTNGYVVTGESACVDPSNYNKEKGEKYAKEKALENVYMLEGYLLKDKLHNTPKDFKDRLVIEHIDLSIKLEKLESFIKTDSFLRMDDKPADLMIQQQVHMHQYNETLLKRINL